MYERILVATDGSRAAAHAVSHAIALGKVLSAELHVLHVARMGWLALGPEFGLDTQRLAAARRTEGKRIVAAALEEARAAGVTIAARSVETDATRQGIADRIVIEAEAWPADLLVLGTDRRRGFQRLILGSVAEEVARRSNVPILRVNGEAARGSDAAVARPAGTVA